MTIYLNQRAGDRSRIRGKIRYSRNRDGIFFDALLNDCGDNGMGIIADHPYLPDTELFLGSKDKQDKTVQSAKVAWSKPMKGSSRIHPKYRIGTKFV